jgi:hypothetical protein
MANKQTPLYLAIVLCFSAIGASEAQMNQRMPVPTIRSLTTSDPTDRLVRQIMDELDALNQTQTVVGWVDDTGSRAIENVGIALNRNEILGFAGGSTDQRFQDALTFTLAHEQTHLIQFAYYSSGTHDLRNAKALETQADILGALSFTALLVNNRRPLTEAQASMTNAFRLPEKFAAGAEHPGPDTRQRAISLGILAELQIVDWRTYRLSKDPDMLARLQDSKQRNPDLPNEGENLMVWSNGVAKRIVGQSQSQ